MRPVSRGSTRIVRLPLFQSRARSPDSPGRRRLASLPTAPRAGRRSPGRPVHPPVEDVPHRRLPGLDAVVAGHDGAVHDAADAGNVLQGLAGGRDGAVAGGGPDDLDERPRLHSRAHRAVVGVEPSHGHGDSLGEAQLLRPGSRRGGPRDDRGRRPSRRAGRAGPPALDRDGRGTPWPAGRPRRRSRSPCGRRRRCSASSRSGRPRRPGPPGRNRRARPSSRPHRRRRGRP